MAKAIRDIVPRKKPEVFTFNTKDYNTMDDGGIRVDTQGVADLHTGLKHDYPYKGAFDVKTKNAPNAADHGHIPAPKDREVNDKHNQRETPREKRAGSAMIANVIARRQKGAESNATSESVEQIDEIWVVKHPDGKFTQHGSSKEAIRAAKPTGGKVMATDGFGGMRASELFGEPGKDIAKLMIRQATKGKQSEEQPEEQPKPRKKRRVVRESKMECESCGMKKESGGSCGCNKSNEPKDKPKPGQKLLTDKKLDEKAVSVSQQRLFGMALAYKRGETSDASEEVKKLAGQMSEKQLRDYAKTKTKGLPYEKVEESSPSDLMMEKAMKKMKKKESYPSGNVGDERDVGRIV